MAFLLLPLRRNGTCMFSAVVCPSLTSGAMKLANFKRMARLAESIGDLLQAHREAASMELEYDVAAQEEAQLVEKPLLDVTARSNALVMQNNKTIPSGGGQRPSAPLGASRGASLEAKTADSGGLKRKLPASANPFARTKKTA